MVTELLTRSMGLIRNQIQSVTTAYAPLLRQFSLFGVKFLDHAIEAGEGAIQNLHQIVDLVIHMGFPLQRNSTPLAPLVIGKMRLQNHLSPTKNSRD